MLEDYARPRAPEYDGKRMRQAERIAASLRRLLMGLEGWRVPPVVTHEVVDVVDNYGRIRASVYPGLRTWYRMHLRNVQVFAECETQPGGDGWPEELASSCAKSIEDSAHIPPEVPDAA